MRKNIENIKSEIYANTNTIRKEKGKLLYRRGLVQEQRAFADEAFITISSKVKSESSKEVYSNLVLLDAKDFELRGARCRCRDYIDRAPMSYGIYLCKHLVATLYSYINEVENEKIDYSNLLLKEIERQQGNKEKIKLEVNLTQSKYRYEYVYDIDFKIGNKKMYVVKSISDLVEGYKGDKVIQYGKDLAYDGKRSIYSLSDKSLLDIISEYVSIYKMFSDNMIGGRGISKFINGKTLRIDSKLLRRILEAVEGRFINFNIDGYTSEIQVVKKNLPLEFFINRDNTDIILKSNGELPKALSSSNDVFLYEDTIYIPELEQCEKYKIYYDLFSSQKEVRFSKESSIKVIEKVLPNIKEITPNVIIEDELNNEIVIEPLEAEFYFDEASSEVNCDVKLKYGDNVIKYGEISELLIQRDNSKENEILKALNEEYFVLENNKFKFKGSIDDLLIFLEERINNLKDFGDIYISDKLKNKKIYSSKSLKTKVTEREDGYLDFSFEIGTMTDKDIKEIVKSLKDKRKYYKLKDDSFINLQDEKMQEFFRFLDNVSLDKLKGKDLKIHKSKALYLKSSLEENDIELNYGENILKDIAKKLDDVKSIDYAKTDKLKATLRDYQIVGVNWFKTLSYLGFGGILADEMGLGKTIQTIAFLLGEEGKKSLIVTPTSLIYNWQNEFEKFAPSMRVAVVHGNKIERNNILNNLEAYDVILTTYGTLKNDSKAYEQITFDYCIIDEGQNIKNPLAKSSEAVKEVNSKIKFVLTGTPMENDLIELWSLFDFIMPGYLFGVTKFRNKFINGNNEEYKDLRKMINPFILRRCKKDVIKELPDKIEKKFFVEMTDEQKKIYAAYAKDIKGKIDNKEVEDRISILAYLTKLRQICIDPALVFENYYESNGKIEVGMELIKDSIKDGHKLLLFSQFTSALEKIKSRLKKEGIEYLYLDGKTKALDRAKLVAEFNSNIDKKIFLISLKSGGTGLNLTSADIVIHYDPWWNPAAEDQATDRAHRIGQENIVEVIKLISKGTVEEKVIKLQEKKQELIKKVLLEDNHSESEISKLSGEDIVDLLTSI